MNYRQLVRSNYFIGFCAFILILATVIIFSALSLEEFYYAVAVFFGTKVVYTFLRKGDNIQNSKEFFQLVRKEIIPVLLAVGFLIASQLLMHHYLLLLVGLLICCLYALHLFGKQVASYSLRSNGWVKLFSIGIS